MGTNEEEGGGGGASKAFAEAFADLNNRITELEEWKEMFSDQIADVLDRTEKLEERLSKLEEWKRVHTQWMNNPESLYERTKTLEEWKRVHIETHTHNKLNHRLKKLEERRS